MATQRTHCEEEALSMARVDRLINLIRDIEQGIPQEGFPEVITKKILPGDYRALLERLKSSDKDISGYFHERLQYEYRPSLTGSTQFSIRLHSPFHHDMKVHFDGLLWGWLLHAFDNAPGKYTPKTAILTDSISPPSYLVVELAWSQSTESLREKAEEFIRGSGGQIRTVVGLDFSGTYDIWDEMKDRWASTGMPQFGPICVFVWRAVYHETGEVSLNNEGQPNMTESSHIFCNNDGVVNLDQWVCLTLQDMIPESKLRQENNSVREELANVELVIDPPTLMLQYELCLGNQKQFDRVQAMEGAERGCEECYGRTKCPRKRELGEDA
ncbi:hypothetical protein GGR51DRAFT_556965 [Nemania sp. FL0031]|nr:hypothetical protein GGR51DRAFT_556965 [Nemania sp. FL0031]